ncbi:pheromone-regulated protein prm10 [Exophiala xenobiotica]|nr:pheromone-regulated protein prm10 [Exophiala xenobiotica]KAK5534359.1 pheromone-regulated protein prm10 [Chaetothyriales sp. CCFEE 6169]KAK5269903.1 pheromone-regulated protein prm10 [Exophiala xenobiotica]KAK5340024.1 pheromone-regulated protein prm10 [Exophiala xenobiotica]KAK5381925.1 pheromone-regulated protein prm10 [Exophiala xenobiotica]
MNREHMADGHHLSPESSSSSSSNNSSANPSRAHSLRGKNAQKPFQKVKFTDAHGEEDDTVQLATRRGRSIPEIRLAESEDVADNTITPPASGYAGRTNAAAALAQNRASRLAQRLSNPHVGAGKSNSGSNTPLMGNQQGMGYSSPNTSPPTKPLVEWVGNLDIPMTNLDKDKRPYTIHDTTSDDDDSDIEKAKPLKRDDENMAEARRLFRTLTNGHTHGHHDSRWQAQPRSGTETPAVDKHLHDVDYFPPPDDYRPGVFGAILSSKLADLQRGGVTRPNYQDDIFSHGDGRNGLRDTQPAHSRANSDTYDSSRASSGGATPSGRLTPSRRPKWYEKPANHSMSSMATLVAAASAASAAPAAPGTSAHVPRPQRPPLPRSRSSSSMIATAVDMIKHPGNHFNPKSEQILRAEEERIIHDVAEIIACRKYLKKLARCLMAVGAPSHRLEEYMKTSARSLGIDGDFLYLPGSMIVSINDRVTMSTEVTLVRETQNVDLGKFKDVFSIYKCVIHGKLTSQEGLDELEDIIKSPKRIKTAWQILAFGIAAVAVGPFAFSARPVDFGPSFILGCTLGFLQLVVVTRSSQFSHVFEVLAAVIISFAARGLGSIYHNGHPVFCFSAIAQSSIALILPGYTVLCAALELQSKNLVAGSVRMVYAIIYSLFLGFGILIGTVLMGVMYPGAQSSVTCDTPDYWDTSKPSYKLIYVKFIWVPIFAVCLALINQAKWRQVPVMALIAMAGYQANFWVSQHLSNNIQVANAIGAFVVGCMANLYSRFFHGLAAAAMLPAIFVQVPSGLAASGSLVAGITSANQITNNATGISIINNGTAGFQEAQDSSTSVYSGTIFNVGYGMVQIAIGISVGLYLSALVVYPIGKRRSGLFSF